MLFPLYVLNPRLRFPIVTLLIIVANILVMGWLSQPENGQRIAAQVASGLAKTLEALPDDKIHAPNESYRLESIELNEKTSRA